jgi:rSAM/selenodomain-associated transferase 1
METLEALGLFFKIPEKGKVKTRLAKDVGEEKALEIYKELLWKTVKISEHLFLQRRIKLFGFYGGERLARIKAFFNFNFNWSFLPQEGKGLGKRLKRAGELLLNFGFERIVFIGADCPFLSLDYLKSAFERLKDYPVVFGPSEDGGYVLLGFNFLFKNRLFLLFDYLPFETTKLLDKTLERLKPEDFSLLPTLFDIDTFEDFQKYLKLT